MGDQEFDICQAVASMTKYCEMVIDPRRIRFCLDNDESGRKAAGRLLDKYRKLGYQVLDCPPPKGVKDYNAWLQAAKTGQPEHGKRVPAVR